MSLVASDSFTVLFWGFFLCVFLSSLPSILKLVSWSKLATGAPAITNKLQKGEQSKGAFDGCVSFTVVRPVNRSAC